MKYKILLTKQAIKDINLLSKKEKIKLKAVLKEVIAEDPFIGKKLVGELRGNYSYRLNIKDRIIYSIDKEKKTIFIKRARTHYDK